MRLTDRPLVKWTITCLCIVAGNALFAFLVAAFIIPHGILMGGVTGISIVLSGVFPGIDVSLFVLLLNVALMFLGLAVLGKTFALTTIAGTLLYPLFLAFFESMPAVSTLTDDDLVAAVFAGCLMGIAIGMLMRVGSSSGGMDIVNLVLNHVFHLPVFFFVVLNDVIIVGGQAFFSAPEKTLLGIIVLVLDGLLLDRTMVLGKARTELFIVSDKYDEIRKLLLNSLNAGVTLVNIETGKLLDDQKAIMCVTTNRKLYYATQLIKQADPHAFVIVTQVNEVLGRGFTQARRELP